METLLTQLDHWHWLILGVVLMILEVLAPAVFFLWLGFAALVTGGISYLMPNLDWKVQVILFSALSITSLAAWGRHVKRRPTESDRPGLNRRGAQYIGRTFPLEEAISNGLGRIRVDDTLWKVTGPDLPAGTSVRIVAQEGAMFQVEDVASTPPLS